MTLPLAAFLALLTPCQQKESPPPELSESIALLRSDDFFERKRAAETISSLGSAARPALPHLLCLLERETEAFDLNYTDVIEAIQAALTSIGPDAVRPLIGFMEGDELDLPCRVTPVTDSGGSMSREVVAVSVGDIGEVTLPALRRSFDKPGPHREWVARAIGVIGPNATSLLPVLMEGQSDPSPRVRWNCLISIWAIAPDTPAAQRALKTALEDNDRSVREIAQRFLRETLKPN